MGHRVIEISESGIFVSRYRGFMLVSLENEERGRVPIEDISVLIVSGTGCGLSSNLLQVLLENNTPVIICGKNYLPAGMLMPISAHHQHAKRLKIQIETSGPLKKRLWQLIVKQKILNQGTILQHFLGKDGGLLALAKRVGSGDSQNLEAQAAKRYWPKIFGAKFVRNPNLGGINSLLNYGYAVLRAGTARSVCAAGLHPALGIHHSNQYNPFSLADDLMEPVRPLVDYVVYKLWKSGLVELNPEVKKKLAGILEMDLNSRMGASSLQNCLLRMGQTLASSLENGKEDLDIPLSPLPLQFATEP